MNRTKRIEASRIREDPPDDVAGNSDVDVMVRSDLVEPLRSHVLRADPETGAGTADRF
jgi:hypothetical protein